MTETLFGIAAPANWAPPQKPERSKPFLRWLRRKPCLVCNSWKEVEAAHTGPHGIAEKSSDYEAIPLCHTHHQTAPDSYQALGRSFFRCHRLDLEHVTGRLQAEYFRLRRPR